MNLVFDRDFDGGAWPGPLAGRDAIVGEAWVGEAGLLGVLETALGLRAPWESATVRAAALVPALRAREAFWSTSAQLDPLGTAGRLLQWLELLQMHGWSGEPVAPRLESLAHLAARALPGPAQRWRTIATTLQRRKADVDEVQLCTDRERLPPLLQRVLASLEAQGTRIVPRRIDIPATGGDLAGARIERFTASGDGSLQLLRSHGPLAAAEAVAAWLANEGSDGTVVIGSDPLLDGALRRFGLPSTGAAGKPGDNALLQALPLVLVLGWSPADPQRALELLTLPQGPVPRSIGRRLIRALHQHPAVGSDAWDRAICEGIEALEEEDRRETIRNRLGELFRGAVFRRDAYPRSEIARRVSLLQQWLQGMLEYAPDAAPWHAALGQCAALLRLVELVGLDALHEPMLHRFVEEATASAGGQPLHPAEAGIATVRHPGALVGKARRVIWWGFLRDASARVSTLPLSIEELAALEGIGVRLPDPTSLAADLAERWRRPLLCAEERLLLVAPRHDAACKEAHPHPLWDEIAAAAGDSAQALVVDFPRSLPRQRRALLPPAEPRRNWAVPGGRIGPREVESPSGMGTLVGCSFKWTLQYVAKVRSGDTAALPATERMIGTAIHALLALLLKGPQRTPEEASEEAERLFAREGPRLAAPLFLPGGDAARAMALRTFRAVAADLYRVVGRGFRIVSVEQPYRCDALGTCLEGTPDLVLAAPGGDRFPVDFKWRGSRYRDALAEGTAYQLAAYSFLIGDGSPGAYWILQGPRLFTSRPDLAAGRPIEMHNTVDPWSAATASYEREFSRLRAGSVVATAVPDGDASVPKKDCIEEGRLVLEPPCRFCDYAGLCGLAFGGK